ncbi:MAG: hypothetical protein B7Z29_16775 [Hyphomicrobium sp. 12-62-95]|nr:MAG: hypothetical protein B7Z29_16775 [Hyphomicrobium sp. 12-62-95]
MHVGVTLHLIESRTLRLDVIERAELLDVSFEMLRNQMLLEHRESQCLGVVLASERFEHADPGHRCIPER